jgi:hypothetical protein
MLHLPRLGRKLLHAVNAEVKEFKSPMLIPATPMTSPRGLHSGPPLLLRLIRQSSSIMAFSV